MRILATIAAILAALVLSPRDARADEKEDATQVERLITEIEKFLPGGWSVAFEVSNDRWRRESPMLVVRSREKLPLEYIASIGRRAGVGEGGDPDPYIVQPIMTIEFEFVPYVTVEDHAKIRKQNEELERRRRRYEETRLGMVQSHYKGGFTPYSYFYESRTKENSPLVAEYAFFWLHTQPRRLPTHYFGTLSVVTDDIRPFYWTTIKIHNSEKQQQYQQILDGLGKVFVPYVKPTE